MRVWGYVWTTPSKIVLRWAFSFLIFLKIGENSKLSVWIFPDFLCCWDISRKRFFWGTTPYSGLCNSAHTCSQFFFSVGFLVRVHIFNLVQVWGQYRLPTLNSASCGVWKNEWGGHAHPFFRFRVGPSGKFPEYPSKRPFFAVFRRFNAYRGKFIHF